MQTDTHRASQYLHRFAKRGKGNKTKKLQYKLNSLSFPCMYSNIYLMNEPHITQTIYVIANVSLVTSLTRFCF